MASTSKYAFEKRYDPQNEKDAEELLEIFANLSDSAIEWSDDEGGYMNNDFAIFGTEEVRVGGDKIGPQTREIVEHLEEEYDHTGLLVQSVLFHTPPPAIEAPEPTNQAHRAAPVAEGAILTYFRFPYIPHLSHKVKDLFKAFPVARPPICSVSFKLYCIAHDEVISEDKDVVLVKWLDHRSVLLASNFIVSGNIDDVSRWDKSEKRYGYTEYIYVRGSGPYDLYSTQSTLL
ncbi:hypothetical protein QE152_g24771 [Popillia japonica]|uniref:Uncharacterized protein n=1 Tax=Popillia japonica TaxID=7064 RepID=A0AAW1K4I3_POPJA